LACTTVGLKRRDIGLGPYPDVGLAKACHKAAETKKTGDADLTLSPAASKKFGVGKIWVAGKATLTK
jgi:hypothetical protein